METTVLSNQKNKIRCLIRKEWVLALPEEIVRQHWLAYMIEELGFPKSGIAVEISLRHMPHLQLENRPLPDRRADIICFTHGTPLLLIECKAVKLTPKAINQVLGYNHHVRARFVATANEKEIQTGWYDPQKKQYTFINYLPTYAQLSQ